MIKGRISLKILASLVATFFYTTSLLAADEQKMEKPDEGVIDSYVMLYYEELDSPRKFYGELLGFSATMEDDWLSLYKINSASYLGVILEGGTAYHPARPENSVMLSLTVADVDAWYDKVRAVAGTKILKEIYDHSKAPIRAFVVEDPGGYTVEIFEWVKK